MVSKSKHAFEELTPDTIIQAIETTGVLCDGRVNALNSYENRVFQIGVEDSSEFLIAKFYRPNRWSLSQIKEEHELCFQLQAADLPVITPICFDAESVFAHLGFYFSLFPMKGGRSPEISDAKTLQTLGRLLARLHNVGETENYSSRPFLDWQNYGQNSIDFVSKDFIPYEHKSRYDAITQKLQEQIQSQFETEIQANDFIRVHGDLHIGNILIRDDTSFLVDFDDSRMAPAIQDVWMLLSGEIDEQKQQLHTIIQAYEEFRPFPFRQLDWIESLRTLRMIHHCAWLAQRWDDPAFAPAFPWFDSNNYWLSHINDLENQLKVLNFRFD